MTAAITPSGVTAIIAVLANDLDDNGDPLTIAGLTQPVGGAATGVAVDNGDGTVSFVPAIGFRGSASFTYTVTDGFSTDTATVTVTVLNAPPVAAADAVTTPPGTPVDIAVLGNDSDPNGDTLTMIDVSTPSGGTSLLGPGNVITYAPDPAFKGVDTFTYTISDGTDTATATVTVTVPNSPPVGAADRRTTESGAAVTVPVLANDFDPNDDALALVASSLGAPANGVAVANADGTVTYTPDPGFKGIDTLTYVLTDGTDTASATVTITVNDGPPSAVDDAATTMDATPVSILVLSNDADPNNDPLTVVATTEPDNGTVVLHAGESVTYTPDAAFVGVDTFTYTITDGTATATATVTATVVAVAGNGPPIAVADLATTPADTPVTVAPLDNDNDPDDDQLRVDAVTQPPDGAVVVNDDGTLTYTPSDGFAGRDRFRYTISDGTDQDSTTVTITVLPAVAEPPATTEAPAPSPNPGPSADPTPDPRGPLAFTGLELGPLLAVALTLLLVGSTLVAATRRSGDDGSGPVRS